MALLMSQPQNRFLHSVVDVIQARYPDQLANCCFIFPNDRPERYLREILSNRGIDHENIGYQPIDDFVFEYSGLTVADEFHLLHRLLTIYRKDSPEEQLDSFFAWGQLMLRDFNEVDANLVPIDRFMESLSELKEIDFAGESEMEGLHFLSTIQKGSENQEIGKFISTWEKYTSAYEELSDQLLLAKEGYAGMHYRKLIHDIERQSSLIPDTTFYFFVGFSRMNKATQKLIRILSSRNRAAFFQDTDVYFEENPMLVRLQSWNQNGTEIRNELAPWDQVKLGSNPKKKIRFGGYNGVIGQASGLKNLLDFDNIQARQNIGIILADPQINGAVLNRFSESEQSSLLITTGRPAWQSRTVHFIRLIEALWRNYSIQDQSFGYKEVVEILCHPLICECQKAETVDLLARINRGIYRVEKKHLQLSCEAEELCRLVFDMQGEANGCVSQLEKIVDVLESKSEEDLDAVKAVIKRIAGYLQGQIVDMSCNDFWKIFDILIQREVIPVRDSALDKTHLMTFSEARALDFQHLYVLGMNEGIFPGSSSQSSYIPMELRKFYGLPVRSEMEADDLYQLYRLFGHAENVTLIYSDSPSGTTGEASRVLSQIQYLLADGSDNQYIERIGASIGLAYQHPKPIEIQKTDKYYTALDSRLKGEQKITSDNKIRQKGLSPSLITTYAECPLKFYLSYVARLAEDDNLSEDLQANELGTVLHKILEDIYAPYIGKEVSPAVLDRIGTTLDINKAITSAALANGLDGAKIFEKNAILVETIRLLVLKVLELDRNHAPFYIHGLEHSFDEAPRLKTSHPDYPDVSLTGNIDRIDYKQNELGERSNIRIIDYKTGSVDVGSNVKFNLETNPKITYANKPAFQVMMYQYMLYQDSSGNFRNVSGHIYPFKKLGSILNINKGDSYTEDTHQKMEEFISGLVSEMLDREQLIIQTTDLKTCSYCSYNHICQRTQNS